MKSLWTAARASDESSTNGAKGDKQYIQHIGKFFTTHSGTERGGAVFKSKLKNFSVRAQMCKFY